MRWASPYQGAIRCAAGPAGGAVALLAGLLERYPQTWSGGIFNCRSVRGGSTTSLHGEGRAVDLMLRVGANGRGTSYGHSIVTDLAAVGIELGVQFVIYDRRRWSAAHPRGAAYLGLHPHYDHLHIELTRLAAATLTLARVRQLLRQAGTSTPPAPLPPPADDLEDWYMALTAANRRKLNQLLDRVNVDQLVDLQSKLGAADRAHLGELIKASRGDGPTALTGTQAGRTLNELTRHLQGAGSSPQGLVYGALGAVDAVRDQGYVIDPARGRHGAQRR